MTPLISSILMILDAFGCGAVIGSVDGTIHGKNPSAERILPLMLKPHSPGSMPNRLPRNFLAMLDASAPGPACMGMVGARPYLVHKLPLDPDDATFLLICIDLNTSRPVQVGLLERIFGLTPCEAQLTKQLSTGASLRDIAARRGVGIGTLRGQLKSIFVKTGTNRQPELVAILSRLVSFCGRECPSNPP